MIRTALLALVSLALVACGAETPKDASPVEKTPAAAPSAETSPATKKAEAPPAAKKAEAPPAAKKDDHAGHDHAGHDHAEGEACSCGAGKAGATVWCDACGAGYIKGEKTKDKAAVTAALAAAKPAAEAKGHDHAGHDHHKACACGAGKAGGTVWCDACGAGYIKGEKTKDKAAVTAALAAVKPAPEAQ